MWCSITYSRVTYSVLCSVVLLSNIVYFQFFTMDITIILSERDKELALVHFYKYKLIRDRKKIIF
jgi:hypothetical protein